MAPGEVVGDEGQVSTGVETHEDGIVTFGQGVGVDLAGSLRREEKVDAVLPAFSGDQVDIVSSLGLEAR